MHVLTINVVDPKELTNGQLLAEYRSIPKVFSNVERAIDRGRTPDDNIPDEFCYGKGAVTFWYNKLRYLKLRQALVCDEMRVRGMQPKTYNVRQLDDDERRSRKDLHNATRSESFDEFSAISHPGYWNDYEPTPRAITINRRRLAARKRRSESRKASKSPERSNDLEEFLKFL